MMKLTCHFLLRLLASAIFVTGVWAGEPDSRSPWLTPLADSEWNQSTARHLLWRAGCGGTPQEVEKLHAMGLDKAVDFLVDYNQRRNFDCPLEIGPKPQPQFPKGIDKGGDKAREIRRASQKAEREQYQDLRAWWIQRMVHTSRPLEEKLTLFWHGLLASGYSTVKDSYAMYNQNQLYRSHAAGNYGKLLHELVHDPAMLRYLDNNSNVRGRPNENLAREIMELFSMGEGQGYTEKDIAEAARALTGNVFDGKGNYVFRKRSHDFGKKTIFGKTGNYDGDDVVDLILAQPATSRYISGKLFAFFAYEDPEKGLANELAKELRSGNYEMRPFLKTLFRSRAFYSERCRARQVKSPVQLVIGSARALDFDDRIKMDRKDYLALAAATASMEQDIFQPPNVKGWDGGQAWINTNTVFMRYNFAGRLEYKLRPKWDKKNRAFVKGQPDAITLLKGRNLKDSTAVVNYLVKALFVAPPASAERARLISFLDEEGTLPPSARWTGKGNNPQGHRQRMRINDKLTALIVLMMSMPEYQVN